MQCDERVRVFARLRPTSVHESAAGLQSVVEVAEARHAVRVVVAGDACNGPGEVLSAPTGEAREFLFDGVFPAEATQQDIYLAVGLPVLRECMSGVNGTIFAYGQTGSGKTHSLLNQGPQAEDAGLLPRLVAGLFEEVGQDVHCLYEVEAAAMQVYNEQVDDLIHPDHQAGAGHNLSVQNGGEVSALTWVCCQEPEDMLDAFTRARSNVVYAETKMNKASSRSHAIFQIRLTRRKPVTEVPMEDGAQWQTASQRMECTRARFSIVDLAGSERVKKSGVEGVHFREATAINKSLLALGNVVSALAAKKAHVPLRDSKLTRILDGSIGGNCKTVLLACASPVVRDAQETLSSLEFASRAMRVEVHARVNRCVVEVKSKALLAELRNASAEAGVVPMGPELRAELESLRQASVEANERARHEAELREKAVAKAQSEVKRLQQLADEAERRGSCLQMQSELLEQSRLVSMEEKDDLRQALTSAEELAAKWRAVAEAHEDEVGKAQEALALASAESERAATRATLAEEAAVAWEARALKAEQALEIAVKDADRRVAETLEQAATERQRNTEALCTEASKAGALQQRCADAAFRVEALEAELARTSEREQQGAAALAEANAALDALRSQARACERELRQELEDAKAQCQVEAEEARARAAEATEQALEEERARLMANAAASEARSARKLAAQWADERSKLEEAHAAALRKQRESHDARVTDLKGRLKAERCQLRRQLEEQRSQLDAADSTREEAVREAVYRTLQEASEQNGEQQRRQSAAFKAARALAAAKEAELRKANDEMAQRLASARSCDDCAQQISAQLKLIEDQRYEIEGLRRELQNRDNSDRIFSTPEMRRSRSRGQARSPAGSDSATPSLPPLRPSRSCDAVSTERAASEGRDRVRSASRKAGRSRGSRPAAHPSPPQAPRSVAEASAAALHVPIHVY